jgi:aminoglycoside/choline kinase family phosphotransferase|tara:strand:+ start:1973 stop:2938 length:966 start_codon:yes stop_codon:yes gene_type:complete
LIDSEVIQVSKECGFIVSKVHALKLEASGREYYRITEDSGETFVLCYLDPNLGNHSNFQHISKFLFDQNVRCPEIIFYDGSLGITIQEDLGDQSLIDLDVLNKKYNSLLQKSLGVLTKIQTANVPQIPKLNQDSLFEQMNMMENFFIKDFLSMDSHNDFKILKTLAIEELLNQPWMNCHFDFERRNLILLEDNEIAVVDYQDLCSGPVGIDLAGLLIDHYVKYPDQQIMESLASYSSLIEIDVSPEEIFEWVRWGAIQRNMRILGILSKIYIDTDRSFRLKDLPQILNNLIELIPDKNFTALKKYLNEEVHQNLLVRLDKI